MRFACPVLAAGAALLAAVVIGGCGSSHAGVRPSTGGSSTGGSSTGSRLPAPHTGPLMIAPARPTTHSTIRFTFTAPVASGVHGSNKIGYSLSIAGTSGPRCVSAHEAVPPASAKGARTTVSVSPDQLGKPWCPGSYTARVIELRSANCSETEPCPMFVGVVGIAAESRFTIRRS